LKSVGDFFNFNRLQEDFPGKLGTHIRKNTEPLSPQKAVNLCEQNIQVT